MIPAALIRTHRRAIAKIEDAATAGMLAAYRRARSKIVAKLESLDTRGQGEGFTAQHYALILVQVDDALREAAASQAPMLGTLFGQAVEMSAHHVVAEIAAAERRFAGTDMAARLAGFLPVIPAAQVARLADARKLRIENIAAETKQAVSDTLAESVTMGHGIPKTVKALHEVMDGKDWQLERLARTEIAFAANAGHDEAIAQATHQYPALGLKKQWSATACLGKKCRTCDRCIRLDGVVVDADAKFGIDGDEVGAPPLHANCLPGDALVSPIGRVTAGFKRWYDGDLVIIRTAGGHQLSCTPNHPILTPSGWVAAGLLVEGGHVISSGAREWVCGVDHDGDDVPARIEDVAESFGRSQHVMAMPVPVTPEDFHGDGVGSDVAIVWADRLLGNTLNTKRLKLGYQGNFSRRCVKPSILTGLRARMLLGIRSHATTGGDMGRCGKCGSLIETSLAHSDNHRFTSPSDGESVSIKGVNDSSARASYLLGNNLDRLTSPVRRINGGSVESKAPGASTLTRAQSGRFQFGSKRLPGALYCRRDPRLANSQANGDFHGGLASTVTLSNDIRHDVDFLPWEGHPNQLEIVPDGADANTQPNCNISNRFTKTVGGNDVVKVLSLRSGAVSIAERNTSTIEVVSDGFATDAELARKIQDGHTGSVFEDKVVYLVREQFSGHVFNLSTESGAYVANGVVTHNCRCRCQPFSERWGGKQAKTQPSPKEVPVKKIARLADLPDVVRKHLAPSAQNLYRRTANRVGKEAPATGAVHVDAPLGTDGKPRRKKPRALDAQRLLKASEAQRYTLGVVYEPGVVDSQDDMATAEEIEQACRDFNRRRIGTGRDVAKGALGIQHQDWDDAHGEIMESYIAPCEMQVGGQTIQPGTWLMGCIWSPEVWKKIQAGELTGLSMGGKASREAV